MAAVSVARAAFAGNQGWALGSAGTAGNAGKATLIWHTSTGGATWQVQWRGGGSPLALTATDRRHAWALLGCPSANGAIYCGRRLIGTADGGARWRVIATLPATAGLVQFGSGRAGVAVASACLTGPSLPRCAGELLVSHDGGGHWRTALTARDPLFATVNGSGQVWAARAVPGDVGRVEFLTSSDGGRRWRRLGTLTGFGPLSAQVQVTLAAGPAGLTWASVFDLASCTMHGCVVANLYGTTDGGRSWRVAALPDPRPDECGPDRVALSLAPDGTAWAATGRNGAACNPPLGLVYRLDPARSPLRALPRWRALPPWRLAEIAALDAVSADLAYAISDQGTLSRTADGGRHWTRLLPGQRSL